MKLSLKAVSTISMGSFFYLLGLAACANHTSLNELERRGAVQPLQVLFDATYLHASSTAEIWVESVTVADLTVISAEFRNMSSDVMTIKTKLPREIPGSQKISLVLEFSPINEGVVSGELSVETSGGRFVLPVSGEGASWPICEERGGCVNSAFDPFLGKCNYTDLTGACDDGNACTELDTCESGVCKGVASLCDDNNPCTLNVCDEQQGCVFSSPTDCDDGNPCTADGCDPAGGCFHNLVSDGTACGVADCSTRLVCHSGVCEEEVTPDFALCNDGSVCTSFDHCESGECVGIEASCDDDVTCTLDVCDPVVGCEHHPRNTACDDGDPCTLDRCSTGEGCENDTAPDFYPCGEANCSTVDLCFLGSCTTVETPDGAPCDDGDSCTENDVCSANTCNGDVVARDAEVVGVTPQLWLPRPPQHDFVQAGSFLVISSRYRSSDGDTSGNVFVFEATEPLAPTLIQTLPTTQFLQPVDESHVLGISVVQELRSEITLYAVGAAGLSEVSTSIIEGAVDEGAWSSLGLYYACAWFGPLLEEKRIAAADFRDLLNPVVIKTETPCGTGEVVTTSSGSLGVLHQTGLGDNQFYSLSANPLNPVFVGTFNHELYLGALRAGKSYSITQSSPGSFSVVGPNWLEAPESLDEFAGVYTSRIATVHNNKNLLLVVGNFPYETRVLSRADDNLGWEVTDLLDGEWSSGGPYLWKRKDDLRTTATGALQQSVVFVDETGGVVPVEFPIQESYSSGFVFSVNGVVHRAFADIWSHYGGDAPSNLIGLEVLDVSESVISPKQTMALTGTYFGPTPTVFRANSGGAYATGSYHGSVWHFDSSAIGPVAVSSQRTIEDGNGSPIGSSYVMATAADVVFVKSHFAATIDVFDREDFGGPVSLPPMYTLEAPGGGATLVGLSRGGNELLFVVPLADLSGNYPLIWMQSDDGTVSGNWQVVGNTSVDRDTSTTLHSKKPVSIAGGKLVIEVEAMTAVEQRDRLLVLEPETTGDVSISEIEAPPHFKSWETQSSELHVLAFDGEWALLSHQHLERSDAERSELWWLNVNTEVFEPIQHDDPVWGSYQTMARDVDGKIVVSGLGGSGVFQPTCPPRLDWDNATLTEF